RTRIRGDGRLPGVAGTHDTLTGPSWGRSVDDSAELRFADARCPLIVFASTPFGVRLFLRGCRSGRGLGHSLVGRFVRPPVSQGKKDRRRHEEDDAAQPDRLAHELTSGSSFEEDPRTLDKSSLTRK